MLKMEGDEKYVCMNCQKIVTVVFLVEEGCLCKYCHGEYKDAEETMFEKDSSTEEF